MDIDMKYVLMAVIVIFLYSFVSRCRCRNRHINGF